MTMMIYYLLNVTRSLYMLVCGSTVQQTPKKVYAAQETQVYSCALEFRVTREMATFYDDYYSKKMEYSTNKKGFVTEFGRLTDTRYTIAKRGRLLSV